MFLFLLSVHCAVLQRKIAVGWKILQSQEMENLYIRLQGVSYIKLLFKLLNNFSFIQQGNTSLMEEHPQSIYVMSE